MPEVTSAAFKGGGAAATGAAAAKARAERLLAAPLLPSANDLEASGWAAEEAAHSVVAAALGRNVVFVSACHPQTGVQRGHSVPANERAAYALAGILATKRDQTRRALDAGSLIELSKLLSDGDWAELRRAVDTNDSYCWVPIREGAALARALLAINRPAVERVKDALLRNTSLDGADLAALVGDLEV